MKVSSRVSHVRNQTTTLRFCLQVPKEKFGDRETVPGGLEPYTLAASTNVIHFIRPTTTTLLLPSYPSRVLLQTRPV